MLIDTHCHLNMMVKKEFDTPLQQMHLAEVENIVQEAAAAGVKRLITVGTSIAESKNCVMIAEKFESVFASIGIHPGDTKETWQHDLAELKKYHNHPKVVAIGECGLDYHYPEYNKQLQQDAFRAQIELALHHDKALIVHTRDAYDDTLEILNEYRQSLKRVVMHCFSQNKPEALDLTDRGFLLGIAATVTYPKNNELRSIVKDMSLSKIILETDAPFLPPQGARGQQNHPRHIATVAHYLAQFLNVQYEEIAEITTANAKQLFKIG